MITDPVPEDSQQRIWQVVAAIPRGKVASYGQVAELAGLPRAARLVGRILKNLPAGSKLPWHRVIRSNGKLAFATDSEQYHCQLDQLQAEGIAVINARVNPVYFLW